MNKKAGMQLSINMIVVLIIAVVILGLALGFINGMFGKIEKDFISRAEDEPNAPTATPSDPLTLSRSDTIVASPGEEIVLKWGVYCTDDGTVSGCVDTKLGEINCGTGLTISSTGIQSSDAVTIAYGNSDQIITLVTVPKDTTIDKYLCTAKIVTTATSTTSPLLTKDLILNIMK